MRLLSSELENHRAAFNSMRAGASLYFRAPPDVSKVLVESLGKDTNLNFGILYPDGENRGEVETFVSRAGHTTDFHFDYMTNFTLQLKGSKVWKFKKGQVKHPSRGATPHYKEISTLEQQNKLHNRSEGRENFDAIQSACKNEDTDDYETVTLHEGHSHSLCSFCEQFRVFNF